MDATTIRQALIATTNPDATVRNAAEAQLKQSFETDPANHLFLLSQELADESSPSAQGRALAGILLKNYMTSKEHQQAVKLANDWMSLNPEIRNKVKANSVNALGSSQKDVRLASAQVISKIATIELPKQQWEDLVQALLSFVVKPEANPSGVAKKEAALHTIGYICEEIAQLETDCLHSKSNDILTAVVAGMRTEEQDLNIKIAATQALANALEFADRNFQVDAERNYIMQVICEACTTQASEQVRENAFQCLGRIAELYYDKLMQYMQALLELTISAISTQPDAVARQAIAFWIQICDVEYDRLLDGDSGCNNFVKGAAQYLIPVLLTAMAQQEEGQDDESFNKSTEAAFCLASISQVIRDEVVERVVPWVGQHVRESNWRLCEAAIVAFGCIMDGPDDQLLTQAMNATQMLENVLTYLKKDSQDTEQLLIKNSSAWTLMRVCEMNFNFIKDHLEQLVPQICMVIPGSEPKTANHLCWCIHHISSNLVAFLEDLPTALNQFPLSNVFVSTVECLIATGDRSDASEDNLRATAYEALNALIGTANPSKCPGATPVVESFIVPVLLPMLGERLNQTFTMQVLNADDNNTRSEWQSFFCGAIQTCISNMSGKTDVLMVADASGLSLADKLMTLFLQVFSSQNTMAAQEALLAVDTVLNVLEQGFQRYMQSFGPILVSCVHACHDAPLCVLAVTTVSDLARCLEGNVTQYCDPLVEALLTVFHRAEVDADYVQVHDYIKPAICSSFGDVAMAITKDMEKYLQYWFRALQTACQTCLKLQNDLQAGEDEDLRNYLTALTEGVFDGYVGILHGLKQAEKDGTPRAVEAFFTPVALKEGCLVLIESMSNVNNSTEETLKKAVGLLGDLGETYQDKIKPHLNTQAIMEVLKQASDSDDKETKDLTMWARKYL